MQKKYMFQNFDLTETRDPRRPIMAGCRVRDQRQIGDWDESWITVALSRGEVIEIYEYLKKFLGV